jgi:hypothetical protein
MAEHLWTVLCEKATVDEKSNVLSLHRIIEQVEVSLVGDLAPGPIHFPVDWTIASMWARTVKDKPEKALARVLTVSASGAQLGGGEFELDLSSFQRIRALSKLTNFSIDRPGLYWLKVEARASATADWTPVGRTLLEVVIRQNGALLI